MKKVTLIFLLTLICLLIAVTYSCKKTTNGDNPGQSGCKYESRKYVDTSLYVSFSLDGVDKKYYQIIPTWQSSCDGTSLIYDEKGNLIYRSTYVSRFLEKFDTTQILRPDINGDFIIRFSKRNHYGPSNNYSSELTPNELYSQVLFPSYTVDHSLNPIYPEDTIFMNGYSLDLLNEDDLKYMSTDNVFIYYSQNKNSITSYFNGSNFNITKVELQCNNYYLMEGNFNSSFMSKGANPINSNLRNGKFRFIRKFE
jgi:hypothetical protein